MNKRAQKRGAPTPIPIGLRKLWREAKGWVAWLLTAVDRTALPAGITREQGAKLSIWLMNIESAVRRLILAAALSFQLPALRNMPCATQGRIARKQSQSLSLTRRPGFCVFRLAASGDAPPAIPSQLAQPAKARAQKPYGHVPFPADPLLNLGPQARQHRFTAPRHASKRNRHPLDRWVRPSRRDPDWREPDTRSTMFSDPERLPTHKNTSRGKRCKREPHTTDALPESLYDWRRRYDEWHKLIPAPDLAARLDALARITANPTAAITSAARRLARSHEQTLMRARRATPHTRVPRHAAHLYVDHRRIDLPERCHTAITHADTS